MNCPNCNETLKEVEVQVEGAERRVKSLQCVKCDYYSFERDSSHAVLQELRNTPLKIKHKIVKLSQDRLGIYFSKHIVESLELEKGEELYISAPDKKHLLVEIR